METIRTEPRHSVSGTASAKESRTAPSKWVVLAIVALGAFMANLDASIVNIGLPTIARAFGVPPGGAIEWIIIAYLLVIAALLLSVGRLADVAGRKRIWITGLTLFLIGSALCGAASALLPLILARGLQGIGAAMLMTLGPALLTQIFPPSERGRALGGLAVAVALGASAGPSAGGLIIAHLSWRWIFWVNLPIGVVNLGASALFLSERRSREQGRFDLPGAFLLGAALVACTLGLSFGQEWGWTSPRLVTVLAVGIGALVALAWVERRAAQPLISAILLRNRVFLAANASLILGVLGLFAVSFLVPFYLEALRRVSPVEAGLIMSALPLTLALVAPISGALADRFGPRWLTFSGLALACLGLLLLARLDAHTSIVAVILCLVVTGGGQGMFQAPNNSAIMGAASSDQQASAAGFLATGRVVGQSLSVAVAGAIFAAGGGALAGQALLRAGPLGSGQAPALQAVFLGSFHAVFLACAAMVALGCAATLGNSSKEAQPHLRYPKQISDQEGLDL